MISVVMSTYQQGLITPWVLGALSQQDVDEPFEIIVCDDGSNDSTLTVVAKCAQEYNLDLRYLWQPDLGWRLSRARNNGIRCAQGELLVFIDGDIIVPPNFLSAHRTAHAESSGPLIVSGCALTVDWGDIEKLTPSHPKEIYRECSRFGVHYYKPFQLRMASGPAPWMGCIGGVMSMKSGPAVYLDEAMTGFGHEDCELFCRLYHQHGYSIAVRTDIEVCNVRLPQQSSGNPIVWPKHESIAQFVRNCLYFKDKYPELDLSEAMWPLTSFVIDPDGRWRPASVEERKRPLREAIADAEAWARSCERKSDRDEKS